MKQLNGFHKKQLQDALIDAFRRKSSLRQMVLYSLDENLDAIADGDNLSDIVFELIEWADSCGRLLELTKGACDSNPGNSQLKEIASQLLSVEEPQKEDGHIADVVHDIFRTAEEQLLKQITTSIPSSQRTTLKEEINQAETWISEGNNQQAAEAFAHIATVLAQSYNLAQASHYAVKAAEQYLEINDQVRAAEQYLQSAEFWLESVNADLLLTHFAKKK
jgi:hypothetical protein